MIYYSNVSIGYDVLLMPFVECNRFHWPAPVIGADECKERENEREREREREREMVRERYGEREIW